MIIASAINKNVDLLRFDLIFYPLVHLISQHVSLMLQAVLNITWNRICTNGIKWLTRTSTSTTFPVAGYSEKSCRSSFLVAVGRIESTGSYGVPSSEIKYEKVPT